MDFDPVPRVTEQSQRSFITAIQLTSEHTIIIAAAVCIGRGLIGLMLVKHAVFVLRRRSGQSHCAYKPLLQTDSSVGISRRNAVPPGLWKTTRGPASACCSLQRASSRPMQGASKQQKSVCFCRMMISSIKQSCIKSMEPTIVRSCCLLVSSTWQARNRIELHNIVHGTAACQRICPAALLTHFMVPLIPGCMPEPV